MVRGVDPMWLLGQSDHAEFLVRLSILIKAEKFHAQEERQKLEALAEVLGVALTI